MRKSGISGAVLLAAALAVGWGIGGAARAEQARQETQGEPERKAQIDAAQEAEHDAATQKALAAQRETERLIREQEAETRRLADEQRREVARVKAIERERSCVIRPVMADADIDRCKWAWGVPPPN